MGSGALGWQGHPGALPFPSTLLPPPSCAVSGQEGAGSCFGVLWGCRAGPSHTGYFSRVGWLSTADESTQGPGWELLPPGTAQGWCPTGLSSASFPSCSPVPQRGPTCWGGTRPAPLPFSRASSGARFRGNQAIKDGQSMSSSLPCSQ